MKEIQIKQRERLTIDKIVMNENPNIISVEEQMMAKGGNIFNRIRDWIRGDSGDTTYEQEGDNYEQNNNIKNEGDNYGFQQTGGFNLFNFNRIVVNEQEVSTSSISGMTIFGPDSIRVRMNCGKEMMIFGGDSLRLIP